MTRNATTAITALLLAVVMHAPAWADCGNPTGIEGQSIYNSDYHTLQFCDGTNWISMAASGIGSETDPQVGTLTNNKWCSSDGSAINCTQDAPTAGAAGTSGELQYNSGGSFGGATALVYATSGSHLTVTAQAATDKPLIVKGAASQSANLMEIQNSSATPLVAVDSAGKVGIGTTSPNASALLHLYGGVSGTTRIRLDGSVQADMLLQHSGAASNVKYSQIVNDNGKTVIRAWNDALSAVTFSMLAMDHSNGNVGIGTTSPATKLYVNGTVTATLFAGSGASLTALSASNLSTGTVGTARLGSGTANSTTYLRGDSTWATPSGGSASGSDGYVQFAASSALSSDSAFVWDNTDKRLGIGTASPGELLEIYKTAASNRGGFMRLSSSGGAENVAVGIDLMPWRGRSSPPVSIQALDDGAAGAHLGLFTQTASGVAAERMRITAAGNVGIGSAVPTTKLDVNGTVTATLFSGSGASLTALNASNLSSGTVGTARLGSGTANSSTFLRGDGTWAAGSATASGSDGYVQFAASSALSSDSAFVWDNTNKRLGIGTATPAYPLTVFTSNLSPIRIANTTADQYSNIYYQGTGRNWTAGVGNGSETVFGVPDKFFFYDTTAAAMRLVIDTSGNVGIGTTSPMIYSGGAGRAYLTLLGSTDRGVLELATNLADAESNGVGSIQFTDKNSTAADKRVAQFQGALQGTTANNRGGFFQFYTKADGASGLTERMRIDKDGKVGIGTASPGYLLHVYGGAAKVGQLLSNSYSGTASIGSNVGSGAGIYVIDAQVDGTSYFQVRQNGNTYTLGGTVLNISSARFKKNIVDVRYGLDTIGRIKIRQFQYTDPLHATKTQIGVVAEELAPVVPEAVDRDEGGRPYAVSYDSVALLGIKAIQELKADNDNLRAELSAMNDNFEHRLRRLETR